MSSSNSINKPYFFRDLAEGIQQQMFFWGQDVLHPSGNLLVNDGFERSQSTGIKGTSCYRREWQGGHVELYGACAGWYGQGEGFCFIRPQRRCVSWLSESETPIPGEWQADLIDKTATNEELYKASLPFLDWLISYELSVVSRFGSAHRELHYKRYKKVPKAKLWLSPSDSLRWFQTFKDSPESLVRPKKIAIPHYV